MQLQAWLDPGVKTLHQDSAQGSCVQSDRQQTLRKHLKDPAFHLQRLKMAELKAQVQAGPRLLRVKELGRDHYPFSWFPKLPYYSESFGCK